MYRKGEILAVFWSVNEMGTGQRPIICQVVALCRPRPDSWLVTAKACRKWPCI